MSKKRYIPLLTTTLITSITITLLATPVFANKTIQKLDEEKKQLQEQQAEVKAQEQEAQQKRDEVVAQKNSLTEEITKLDREIEESENALDDISTKLDQKRQELSITKKDLELAEYEREQQYEAFKQRLKFIHENGDIGYYQVLIKSKDFGDFLNRTEYINDIIDYDQNMQDKLEAAEKLIAQKKDEIELQVYDIEQLLSEEEDKMRDLNEKRSAKSRLMKEVEADEARWNQQIDELIAENASIEAKIRQAQAEAERIRKEQEEAAKAAGVTKYNQSVGSGEMPSGEFGWPVTGYSRLSSGYVNRVNPITGRREFHTGIDIPAPQGTNILAAKAGTVIMSSWNGGYGYCVVIDHGNGVSTLYGHNSALVAKVGDKVSKGDIISKCGSTGMSTGPHCHFEVRINGSPVNPGPYVGL